jgi:glycosyltransferase 2 family protein
MKLKKLLSYCVILVIFSLLLGSVFQNWEQIKDAIVQFSMSDILLILGICTALHFLNALSWHLMTKALGFRIGFFENVRIWMFPNLTRYVPGLVWQYLGRVYLLSQHNVNKAQGTLAVLLDALFTFSVGALVVLLTVLLFQSPFAQGTEWILMSVILIPFVLAFIFSNKRVFDFVLPIVQRITKKDFSTKIPHVRFKWLVTLSFVTFSQFIFAGLALFLIANRLSVVSFEFLPLFAGIYAGSWILGYISFFAPGGLGVQELSMAGLLSLFMPLPLASLAALLFRFTLVFSELIVLTFVFLRSKHTLQYVE